MAISYRSGGQTRTANSWDDVERAVTGRSTTTTTRGRGTGSAVADKNMPGESDAEREARERENRAGGSVSGSGFGGGGGLGSAGGGATSRDDPDASGSRDDDDDRDRRAAPLTARQMRDRGMSAAQIGQAFREGRTTRSNAFSALGALGFSGAIAQSWLDGTATSTGQQRPNQQQFTVTQILDGLRSGAIDRQDAVSLLQSQHNMSSMDANSIISNLAAGGGAGAGGGTGTGDGSPPPDPDFSAILGIDPQSGLGLGDAARRFALDIGISPMLRGAAESQFTRGFDPFRIQSILGNAPGFGEDLVQPGVLDFERFIQGGGLGGGFPGVRRSLRDASNFLNTQAPGDVDMAARQALLEEILTNPGQGLTPNIGSDFFKPTLDLIGNIRSPQRGSFDLAGAMVNVLQDRLAQNPTEIRSAADFLNHLNSQGILSGGR